jgi:hypothetical protein
LPSPDLEPFDITAPYKDHIGMYVFVPLAKYPKCGEEGDIGWAARIESFKKNKVQLKILGDKGVASHDIGAKGPWDLWNLRRLT